MSGMSLKSMLIPCSALSVLLIACLLGHWDQSLFLSMNQFTQKLPDTLWQLLCTLSDPMTAPLLIFVLFYKNTLFIRALVIGCILALLCNYTLKYGFGFPRPHQVLDAAAFHQIGPLMTSPSFPSGHTITIFMVMSLLSHWAANVRLSSSLFVVALIISLGRIGVGAHWPSDLILGAMIGWLVGWAAIQLNKKSGDTIEPKLSLSLYFLGLLAGIFSVVNGTHYTAGLWLSTAVALFTIAYSLRSITELLHRQKG